MFASIQSSFLSLAGLTLSFVVHTLSALLFCLSLIFVLCWSTRSLINTSFLHRSSVSYYDRPHSRSPSNSSTDSSTSTASITSSVSSSDLISSKSATASSSVLKLIYTSSNLAMTFIASRLSISLDGAPASASNFPSPSSSFLPPPTPGAHEFAIKPPAGRKQSASKLDKEASKRASGVEAENGSAIPVEVSTTGPVNGTTSGTTTNGVLNTAISVPLPTSPLPTTPSTPTPGSVLVHRTSTQNGSSAQNGTANGMSTAPSTSSHLEPPVSPVKYTYSSTSASATPTISQVKLPAEYDEPADLTVDTNVSASFGMSGPPSRPLSTSLDPSLFSNRPAPPSPALSATTRRLSRALSNSSRGGGSSSRPTSMGINISRANSLRNKDGRVTGSPREMGAFALPSPIALDGNGSPIAFAFGASAGGLVGTPTTATMKRLSTLSTNSVASIEEHPEDDDVPPSAILIPRASSLIESPASIVGPPQAMEVDVHDDEHATKRPPKHYIKIRDFGFPAGDDRHIGMGDDVPKANRVARVNRKLAMAPSVRARRRESEMSWGSGGGSSASENEGDEEEDWADASWGWGGQRASYGYGYGAEASSSSTTTTNGGGASNPDFDRNFMEQDDGFEDADEEGEVEGEEDQLLPGLYRALYAFEPEGTAEMRLEEDQIVRVVGRGGGVGWAVVVVPETGGGEAVMVNGGVGVLVAEDAHGSKAVRHALVPESYLEPYMLDGWGAEEGAPTA